MRKLIIEGQEDYKFSISNQEFAGKFGPYKRLYVHGETKKLGALLKDTEDIGIGKKFGAILDKSQNPWVFWFAVPKNSNGEFDVKRIVDKKVKPFIDALNGVYEYTLEINKLLDNLEEYVPTESTSEDIIIATSEEVDQIKNRVEGFRDKLINISSSEELQNTLKLMMDVKNGKSAYTFSAGNKIAIKLQRPDATIVCAPSNWKSWYNRTVNAGAKPIFVYTPSDKLIYNNDITRDFLNSVGATSLNDLSGNQKAQLHSKQTKASYGNARNFAWVGFYDVSDTTQIEGTEDQISRDIENSKAAAEKLQGRKLSDIDIDTQTTNDETIIKPVYDGLLAYAQAQNIGINTQGGINVAKTANAASTKLLASALLSQILSGQISGIAAKSAVEAKTPSARRQQAEIASWQFMEAFGVQYNLADIDMDTVFGSIDTSKDLETEKQKQKQRIANVLTDIESAVNHLIDFVNVNIKDNSELKEDAMGGIPQGKHVTVSQIAKELGIPNDMLREINIQTLHERLLKKVLRLI